MAFGLKSRFAARAAALGLGMASAIAPMSQQSAFAQNQPAAPVVASTVTAPANSNQPAASASVIRTSWTPAVLTTTATNTNADAKPAATPAVLPTATHHRFDQNGQRQKIEELIAQNSDGMNELVIVCFLDEKNSASREQATKQRELADNMALTFRDMKIHVIDIVVRDAEGRLNIDNLRMGRDVYANNTIGENGTTLAGNPVPAYSVVYGKPATPGASNRLMDFSIMTGVTRGMTEQQGTDQVTLNLKQINHALRIVAAHRVEPLQPWVMGIERKENETWSAAAVRTVSMPTLNFDYMAVVVGGNNPEDARRVVEVVKEMIKDRPQIIVYTCEAMMPGAHIFIGGVTFGDVVSLNKFDAQELGPLLNEAYDLRRDAHYYGLPRAIEMARERDRRAAAAENPQRDGAPIMAQGPQTPGR